MEGAWEQQPVWQLLRFAEAVRWLECLESVLRPRGQALGRNKASYSCQSKSQTTQKPSEVTQQS